MHRKICKPKECPAGYRWLGAAKIKGESLKIDGTAITDLGDGILLVDRPDPNYAGFLLEEDRDCAYGCVLKDCGRDQYGCVDTGLSSCDICLDDAPLPQDECRRAVERCREVAPLVRESYDTCVFADVVGNKMDAPARCPTGYVCHRLYDESYPLELRLRGICKRSNEN